MAYPGFEWVYCLPFLHNHHLAPPEKFSGWAASMKRITFSVIPVLISCRDFWNLIPFQLFHSNPSNNTNYFAFLVRSSHTSWIALKPSLRLGYTCEFHSVAFTGFLSLHPQIFVSIPPCYYIFFLGRSCVWNLVLILCTGLSVVRIHYCYFIFFHSWREKEAPVTW